MILTKAKLIKAIRRARDNSFNRQGHPSTIDVAARILSEDPTWTKTVASSLKIVRNAGITVEMITKEVKDEQ